MSEQLYGRQLFIEFGVAGQITRYRGLDVSASVKKTGRGSPNTADMEVFGLSRNTVAKLQQPGVIVRLYAGYQTARMIFTGDLIAGGVESSMEGADMRTSISAKDGGDAYLRAAVNESFDAGVSYQEVVDVIAQATGLPLGSVSVPDGQISEGLVLSGTVRDVMDRLSLSISAQWSIQDGALQILPPSEPRDDRAIVVSVEQGNLVGSPAMEDTGLSVTAFADGRFLPGGRVLLTSRDHSGDYRISSLEHRVNSGYGEEFYSDLVLEAL